MNQLLLTMCLFGCFSTSLFSKDSMFETEAELHRANGNIEYYWFEGHYWQQADTVYLNAGDTLHIWAHTSGSSGGPPIVQSFHNGQPLPNPNNDYWALTENGMYHFTSPNADVTVPAMFFIGDAPLVTLDIKVLLGGAYDPSTGLMRDDLRANGHIHARAGTYQMPSFTRIIDSYNVFDPNGANSIVDWVRIEFRDAIDPTIIVVVDHALVQRDGDLVNTDGISPFSTILEHGNYYVAVRHRVHLGAMTAAPIALGSTLITLDFSDQNMPLFGTNAVFQNAGVNLLRPGATSATNFPNNRSIKYTGTDNDRDRILFLLMALGVNSTTTSAFAIPTNNTYSSFHRVDLNMDGVVKYTGVNNDRDVILQTIGGNDPTATRIEQLP